MNAREVTYNNFVLWGVAWRTWSWVAPLGLGVGCREGVLEARAGVEVVMCVRGCSIRCYGTTMKM